MISSKFNILLHDILTFTLFLNMINDLVILF